MTNVSLPWSFLRCLCCLPYDRYPSLTNKIFEGLSCRRLGEGYSVLYVDYSIDCGSTEYAALVSIVFTLVLVWPIGLPVGLFYAMWREKDEIKDEDDDTLQKFSFVLGDYNTEHWYQSRNSLWTSQTGRF